jgi:hypothetical protein
MNNVLVSIQTEKDMTKATNLCWKYLFIKRKSCKTDIVSVVRFIVYITTEWIISRKNESVGNKHNDRMSELFYQLMPYLLNI